MDADQIVVTPVMFWSARFPGRAGWVTAIAPTMCAYQRLGVCDAGPAVPAIGAGEVCFDTGDRIDAIWPAPIVVCEMCARREMPDAAFDVD